MLIIQIDVVEPLVIQKNVVDLLIIQMDEMKLLIIHKKAVELLIIQIDANSTYWLVCHCVIGSSSYIILNQPFIS